MHRPPFATQPPVGVPHTRGDAGSPGFCGRQLPLQQSSSVWQVLPIAWHGASAQYARCDCWGAMMAWLTSVNGGWLASVPGVAPGEMAVTQSFFGAPSDKGSPSSVKYGPQIKVPALVIHGDKDEISFPPNAKAIYDSLTASPQRDLIWVPGASHYLTPGPIAEAYAKNITAWLVKNMPAGKRP